MTRLTKGMYGYEFDPASDLFGLRCGQVRGEDLAHNGGWYNRAGEKLGWGDLSTGDFAKIAVGLVDGELFVVLPENASFWDFSGNHGPIDDLDIEAPGMDYVADNARYAVAPGEIYIIDRHDGNDDGADAELRYWRGGNALPAKYIKPGTLKAMMAGAPAP